MCQGDPIVGRYFSRYNGGHIDGTFCSVVYPIEIYRHSKFLFYKIGSYVLRKHFVTLNANPLYE